MAYIARQTTQEFAAAATATPTLLSHVADDVIFFVITQDGGGTAISVTVATGWTVYDPGSASGGSRQALAYKKAASGSETAPVFNGANDEWILQQFIVKDVDTSTAPDFTPASSAWNAVASKASPSATSVTDDTLVFYSYGADASQKMRHKISEAVYLDNWRHSSGQVSSLVAYRQMFTAGSVPTVTMYAINANEGGHAWVIGFRNKSGGSLQPMPVVTATELRWYGDYGVSHDATTTWGDLQDAGPTTINGIAVSSTAPTVTASSQTGFEATQNGSGTLLGRNTNLATEEWVGGAHAITSFDATGLVLSVQWAITVVAAATFGSEGVIVVLGDSSGGWVSYQLSKRQDTASGFPYWNQIAVGQATEYDSSGTFDITDVSFIGWGYHRLAGSTTNIGILFKNLTFLDSVSLVGGGSDSPCSPSVIANAFNAEWFFKQGERLGSGMTLAKCNVNIGDGSNKLYYDASRTAMELPEAYDQATNRFNNFSPSSLGVTINAAASNTINLTAMAMNANQSQPFTIASGSSTSASYDFTGGAISNHAPVLKTGVPVVGATFASCGEIDAKGATLTNCTISNTTSTDAAIAFSATAGTMDSCTIDVTGTSAAYHLEVGNGGTGNFAITLTDVTFTGTPSTDKVHVTNTSGTTTITISGTTSLVAGDVTTAGATVSIVSDPVNQVVVVSGFTSGSRIQIYDTTNATELFNGTASAGNTVISGTTATWTDPSTAAGNRAIRVRVSYVNGATAKGFLELTGLTCGTTAGTASITYPVTQVDDSTYNSNAIDGPSVYAGSGITFTDAATDLVNCNIAGGTVSWPTIYACFVYWLFTSAGIDDDVTYIEAPDPANYLLTAMKIRNTNSTPLTITGGYGRSATTGLVSDIIDTAGSTGNIFPSPDHVVAYATGSGALTSGDISNIWSNASRTLTGTVNANVTQMNGATVTGTGVAGDLWRGA